MSHVAKNHHIEDLDCCPFCESSNGYYVKTIFSGSSIYRYDWDGKTADNSELHSGLTYTDGKYAYCEDCEKRIAKI